MNNMEIAQIILTQLGGAKRLKLMTGATQFIAVENGLAFSFMARAHYNHIQIRLTPADLYTVRFSKYRGVSLVREKEITDLFNDQLKEVFEEETGLFLSL